MAVVSGIINATNQGASLDTLALAKVVVVAVGFLVGAIVIGVKISPFLFRLATKLRSHGILLAVSLTICFALSYLAALAQLAPIVGAFAAGLILEPVHYRGSVYALK